MRSSIRTTALLTAVFVAGSLTVSAPSHAEIGGVEGCYTPSDVGWWEAESVCTDATSYTAPLREASIPPPWIGRGPSATNPGPDPNAPPNDMNPPAEPAFEPVEPPQSLLDQCENDPSNLNFRFETCATQEAITYIVSPPGSSNEVGRAQWKLIELVRRSPRSGAWTSFVRVRLISTGGNGSSGTWHGRLSYACTLCNGPGTQARFDMRIGSPVDRSPVLTFSGTGAVGQAEHILSITVTHTKADGMATPGSATYQNFKQRTRCDSTIGANRGCVNPTHTPTLKIQSSRFPQWATHVVFAQIVWGYGSRERNKPLNRLRDDGWRDLNWRVACHGLVRPPGTKCDEYPFQSTYQGAAFLGYNNTSRMAIPESESNQQAGVISRFYTDNRVIAGERFWVEVVP